MFIVSSFESIFYLTGAGFEPLERPFFLLVEAERAPVLLVPKLDQEHMTKARGIENDNIITYREYPAPTASGWPSRLKEILPGIAGRLASSRRCGGRSRISFKIFRCEQSP